MDWLDKLNPQQRAIANKVAMEADRQGVPRELALAAAMQESAFNPQAKSKTGPVGVMMLGRAAAKEQGVNRYNLDQNIRGGVGYLKQHLEQQGGDPQRALIAYHDGPSSEFFKGGSMSPAAYNHLQKVKSYGGFQGDIIPMAAKQNSDTGVTIADIDPIPDIPMFSQPSQGFGTAAQVGAAGAGALIGMRTAPSVHKQAEINKSLIQAANAANVPINEANAANLQRYTDEMEQRKRLLDAITESQKSKGVPGYIESQLQGGAQDVVKQDPRVISNRTAQNVIPEYELANQRAQAVNRGQLVADPNRFGGLSVPPSALAPAGPTPQELVARQLGPEPTKPVPHALNVPQVQPIRNLTVPGAVTGALTGYNALRAAEGMRSDDVPQSMLGTVGAVSGGLANQSRNPRVAIPAAALSAASALGGNLLDYIRGEKKPDEKSVLNKAEGGLARLPKFAGKGESLVRVGKKVGETIGKGPEGINSALANRYPMTAPPVLAIDKKSGKEFLQKQNSPEAMMVEAIRKHAQKDIDKGNYTPFFDVSKRFHVDPANYPLQGSTITQAMPKKQATIDKWRAEFDTPEVHNRLTEAFNKAKNDPLTWNWYAMGQLENEYVKRLGPEAGRKAFREAFAMPMAATTGGADPTSNLLMSYYGNYLKKQGMPMPSAAYEMPYPIGGRYASGNMAMYDKVMNQGAGLTTATPKRFNFAADFMGHMDRPTIDEQMSGLYKPGMVVPPGDSYGVTEQVLNDVARQHGVSPVNFQEVAWAGAKGTKGKPMIQHVNEAIERTSRVTGMTPEQVVERSLVHRTSPLYGGAAGVGIGAAQGQVEEKADGGLVHLQSGGNPKMAALKAMATPVVDRLNMHFKDVTKRIPQLQEAAQRMKNGEPVTREEYEMLVNAYKPVKPFAFVPKPATKEEAINALTADKKGLFGAPSQILQPGQSVGLRLDIPAYSDHGVWVPAVHEKGTKAGAGTRVGYESVASVNNPVFNMSDKGALSIASGKPKSTIATIEGGWNPVDEQTAIANAQRYLEHPDWRQVGMDPERHGYFYDRASMEPVLSAEEALQIGPLVLARKPVYGKKEDFGFAKGGLVGLYANIHAKRERIKHGSGEKMRKPGSEGAPTAEAFRESAKTAKLKEGGTPSLSVGRGEKLPVDQGAGLTAKGRAKYNRETGSNLKAPQPEGGPRKDSFCARMQGVVNHAEGDAPRAKAALKRWKC